MRMRSLIALVLCTATLSRADDLLIPSLTLEDYTARAITQGTRGRLIAAALESAGYVRVNALRQTDSPDIAASYAKRRAESRVAGQSTLTDTDSTEVSVHQPTPLGTQVQLTGTQSDTSQPGLSASVTQPLYVFARNGTSRTRQRAELDFANARDSYESDVLAIQSQARGLYYDVMLAEESIKVEERKAASSQKLLDITQALVQAGKKAAVETMRARIRKQSDDRLLQNARVSRDKAVASAAHFIGVESDQPVHFITRLAFRPFRPSLSRLLEYAEDHRPQLRTLRRAQQLARLSRQETQDVVRPALAVNSTYGYSDADPLITHSWSLGGTVSWLFFDSFVTDRRVRAARIDELVADINISEAERALRVNVANAYRDIKNAEKQIMDFQSSREQARHNVEVIRLRFQNGLERLIDVFDAENDMRNLDNEYLGLLVSYQRAVDSLSELVGGDAWGVK